MRSTGHSGRVLDYRSRGLASPEALCCVLEQVTLFSGSMVIVLVNPGRTVLMTEIFFDWDVKIKTNKKRMTCTKMEES